MLPCWSVQAWTLYRFGLFGFKQRRHFVFLASPGDVSTEPPLAEGSCPDESWVQRYGDICYLFQPDMPVTWSEGRRQCQVRGGIRAHLVVIPDLDVNRYIQGMMTEVSVLPMDRGHWIGLSNQTLGGDQD